MTARAMLSDEGEIRRTLAEFGQYLDQRRFEEWAALFTEDATFQHLERRQVILDFMLTEELATIPELFRKHDTTNVVITLSGDTAHVESDLVLFERLGNRPWEFRFGKYIDEFVREDRWLFANRQLHWTANGLG
jgi:3-phenylpropionate/cinnamic acid dioxygenase small subunit